MVRWCVAIGLWCVAVSPAFASSVSHSLAGRWTSAPNETPLSSAFDESVWGPDAKSVRTVDLQIEATGRGVLKVTTRVVDRRGRTIKASTSVEEAKIVVGESRNTIATRVEHDVTVESAVRTYPDDPTYKWELDGLKVQIVTFTDGDGNTLEVRFDTPEGRGSFWETLRRSVRARANSKS
jgi:hypothetical protein